MKSTDDVAGIVCNSAISILNYQTHRQQNLCQHWRADERVRGPAAHPRCPRRAISLLRIRVGLELNWLFKLICMIFSGSEGWQETGLRERQWREGEAGGGREGGAGGGAQGGKKEDRPEEGVNCDLILISLFFKRVAFLLETLSKNERRPPCRKRPGPHCNDRPHHTQEGTTQIQAEAGPYIQEQSPKAGPERVRTPPPHHFTHL